MRAPLLLTLTVAALALALGLVARAAEAEEDIYLNDGSSVRGEVLDVTDTGIKVRMTPRGGGTIETLVPSARLDPHYYYALRDQAAGDDAKAHLKLALWAVEQGLFSRAKTQVDRAAKLDPQLVKDIQEGKLPEIREGIARRVLDSAREDMEKGRLELAQKKVEALLSRMPDTEAGTQARDLLAPLQEKIDAAAEQAEHERLAKLAEEEKKAAEERARLLEPVDKLLADGRKVGVEGLTEDDEQKALQLLGRAASKGEEALKKLERLEKDHGEDTELMSAVAERRTKTIAGLVKVHIHRADIYAWRGSNNNARKELDEARKLDPDNPDIANLEQRIADSENYDAWDLRWQRGRREAIGRFNRGGSMVGGGGRRR